MKSLSSILCSALLASSLIAGEDEGTVCGAECCPEAAQYGPSTPEKATQKFVVQGIKGKGCSKTIAKTLNTMPGITVESICLKTGVTVVSYNPKTVKKQSITKAIEDKNYTVGGERHEFVIEGIHCGECVKRVKSALKELEGVTVKHVSETSTKVIVDVHSNSTTRNNITDTLESLGYEDLSDKAEDTDA